MTVTDLSTEFNIPEIVAANAATHPDSPFFIYSDAPGNITTITHRDFYLGTIRAAHLLRPPSAKQVENEGQGEVVAIVANSSPLIYQTVIAGLMTAGLVPFPVSPRLSSAAVISLLQVSRCHRILATQAEFEPLLRDVSAEVKVKIDGMPALEDLYPINKTGQPISSYPKLHLTNPGSIVMYLHSSGSTGFPKAISYTNKLMHGWKNTVPFRYIRNGLIAFYDMARYMTDDGKFTYGTLGLPPYHGAGFFQQFLFPIYYRFCIAIFPPINVVPSPYNIMDHIRRTKAASIMVIPSLLSSWVDNPDDVSYLKTLKAVSFGGGPLPEEVGDRLVEQGVNLISGYGGTEFGGVTIIDENEKDWRYMRFHPRVKLRLIPQGDDTYEAQFLSSDTYMMAVENLPDVKGYSTKDLWKKHPSKKGLYQIVGRKDDVLIHSNGEKTVPGPIEGRILNNTKISAAVMFGHVRDRAGVLIEPAIGIPNKEARDAFRDEVWPAVEKANRGSPAFSQIYKEMIIVTSPLPRTAKGSVMRKLALQQYNDQIERLYQDVEAQIQNVTLPRSWTDRKDIETWLFDHVVDISKGSVRSSTDDIFRQGFDSLGATFLRLRIQTALRASDEENVKAVHQAISQNFVYDHPGVTNMGDYLFSSINSSGRPQGAFRSTVEEMEIAIKRFASTITPLISESHTYQAPVYALVTGTTGNLGAAILRDLISDSRVHKVYALNRSGGTSTSRERQGLRFKDNGYAIALIDSPKLTLVETDTSKDDLGLESSLLDEIRQNVNLVIHNAWRVNFNFGLTGFEDNIQSLRNLINLALTSPNPSGVRFMFCSSIAVSTSWDKTKGPFPEELQMDPTFAQGSGYGESKYIAERLLAHSGLNATSFRIGQITGGKPRGAWNVTDWVPLLLKSGLSLGNLPSSKGLLSWISCDAVSSTILDVAFAPEKVPLCSNIAHPRPIPWDTVINFMLQSLTLRGKNAINRVKLIPYPKWFERLDQVASSPDKAVMDRVPAIKLLEFFRGITIGDEGVTDIDEAGGTGMLSGEKTLTLSSSLRNLPPLQQGDVDLWIEYWISKGLFD